MIHRPVLSNEVLDLLRVRCGGIYIDGTVGSGGHALEILKRIGATGRLLGIDRDEEAVKRAEKTLADYKNNCLLAHGNYADMLDIAKYLDVGPVDGVLLDIGVSSEQLDSPERGFSFIKDGPLDMRMDRSDEKTAADIVNDLSEHDLCSLLRAFGEEPRSGSIARAVARERANAPITTTGRLADLVTKAAGGRRGRLHPATRTFQALRIAVNDEFDSLERGLLAGSELLASGGRMAVISFHSLEDRIAKRFFMRHRGVWVSLPGGGREWQGEEPVMARVTGKPVRPSEQEIAENPRSRSAKLRVAERI